MLGIREGNEFGSVVLGGFFPPHQMPNFNWYISCFYNYYVYLTLMTVQFGDKFLLNDIQLACCVYRGQISESISTVFFPLHTVCLLLSSLSVSEGVCEVYILSLPCDSVRDLLFCALNSHLESQCVVKMRKDGTPAGSPPPSSLLPSPSFAPLLPSLAPSLLSLLVML